MKPYILRLNVKDREDIEFLRHLGRLRSAAETIRACIHIQAETARNYQKEEKEIS
jgi:hypothetical protein